MPILAWMLAACTQSTPPPETDEAPASQPNFLLIFADDLGYTDIGAYGGEIRTPNLDELASRSVTFTNFHALPMCAPTRAMLLSGTDHHVAGLGTMFGPNFLPGLEGRDGYETYLHERVASLPERLAEVGYRSYMAGKWHLGPDPGQWPVDRGFDRSFVLLPGVGSHMVIPERQYVENNEWVEPTQEGFFFHPLLHRQAHRLHRRISRRRATVLRIRRLHGAALAATGPARLHRPLRRRL